jgi:hypothetical protein
MHIYEVRPRRDHRGVDLICDALPFGGLPLAEFQFQKRSQLLIRTHNEAFSVAAMCVSNEDRLTARIHG